MNIEAIKILKIIGFSALAVVILLSLVNVMYLEFYEKKTTTYRKELAYQDYVRGLENGTITYAFFGDSHVRSAVNPLHINSSFNFGIGGGNYILTYYKLKKITDIDNVSLTFIFLEVDPQVFSSWNRQVDHLWFYYKYFSKDFIRFTGDSVPRSYLEVMFPIIGHAPDFFNLLASTRRTEMYLGWEATTQNFSLENQTGIDHLKFNGYFKDQELLDATSIEYFQKTIAFAKEKNITVIFVQYPASRKYHQTLQHYNFSFDKHYKEIFSVANSTLEQYYFLNYYDLFFDHPEYFGDSDHLNSIGAEALSQIINYELGLLSPRITEECYNLSEDSYYHHLFCSSQN